uniref:Uncharacterized protein n=1 Tax=Sinocyclocheilus grahami TaxID=75366 RepID=A0A672QW56_SINGR
MVQLSKSGVKETLKAGHPPAGLDFPLHAKLLKSLPTPSRMQHLSLLLAGPLEKLGHDFPETPVSVRHSRVRPSVEKPHVSRISICIQQPRKF